MENLEPKKERSPIESLKFQRKSDYKKFRNFIKKETKELKGIVEPKEDKLKSILKVGTGGLGILALGGIINAIKGKDNEDTSGKFKTPFIVGRRNPSDLPKIPGLPGTKIKPSPELPSGQKIRIKTTSKIPNTVKIPVKKPVKINQESLFTSKLKIRKRYTVKKEEAVKTKVKVGAGVVDKMDDFMDPNKNPFDVVGGDGKPSENIPFKNKTKINTSGVDNFTSRGAMNAFLNLPDFEADEAIARAFADKGVADVVAQEAAIDAITGGQTSFLDEVYNTKELKMNRSYNPIKIKAEITFEYMKRRLSQLKSKGSKIFDTLSKTTQNLTPQFLKSDLVKPLFKSKTKTGFFVIDLLFAGQAFADLFKPKDNLRTSVVDFFNAYNNLKYKDDPSKLKYYITESSDERVRAFHIQKNKEIRLLKEQAGVDLGGPQNILIVPDNKQNNEVKTDTSIKKGETKISFLPFEPVNSVGTDILLHKLNA